MYTLFAHCPHYSRLVPVQGNTLISVICPFAYLVKIHKLAEDDLDALCAFIMSAHPHWRDMGRTLGFKHVELSEIADRDGLTSKKDFFAEMLLSYLKWAPPIKPQPSTEDVASALRAAGEHNLAYKLVNSNFMANIRSIGT